MSTITSPIKQTLPWTPRLLKRQALSLLACGMIAVSLSPSQAFAQDSDSFWTQFVPSTDTRLIFVSSSEGSDTNSGLTPDRPVKSLSKAYDLLRDGYPDWMLLKRGDTWYESFPRWSKSGRDEDEKLVVGAYGDSNQRPQVRPDGASTGLPGIGSGSISHVAFVGFHLEPHDRDLNEGAGGISWLKDGEDILFEDLYIDGFGTNMGLQSFNGSTLRDFRVNGCVIVDSWSNNGHSQGLFVTGIEGLIIENSVFDHNGWNLDMGAGPTIFNHNIYIQNGTTNVVFRNNISSDASSHGIQMRSGGVMTGNLFISNPLSMHFGGGDNPDPGGVSATVRHNLVMYGRDIRDGLPRGFGLTATNVREATINSNYFHLSNTGYNHQAMQIGGGGLMAENITISNNIVLGWHGTIQIQGGNSGPITLDNNTIYRDLTHGGPAGTYNIPMIELPDSWQGNTELRNNTYRYHNLHSRPFKAGGSIFSPDAWQSEVEPSAVMSAESSPPPSFGLDLYMLSIDENGDWQDFVQQARSNSRSTMDEAFTAKSVIEWFENNISALNFSGME